MNYTQEQVYLSIIGHTITFTMLQPDKQMLWKMEKQLPGIAKRNSQKPFL